MQLADYLKSNRISAVKFAEQIGVSKQTIYNYLAHPSEDNYTIPRLNILRKINTITSGEVSVRDFYEYFEKEGDFEKFEGHTEVV